MVSEKNHLLCAHEKVPCTTFQLKKEKRKKKILATTSSILSGSTEEGSMSGYLSAPWAMQHHLLQGHWLFLDWRRIVLRLREDPSDRKSPSTPPSCSHILGRQPDWMVLQHADGDERGKPIRAREPSSFQLQMTSCSLKSQPCMIKMYIATPSLLRACNALVPF